MKKLILALLVACSTLTTVAQNLRQTVENGVQTSIRQSENHLWREAFATCRALDAMLGAGNPDLHYLVSNERFRLYTRLNKSAERKAQMALMENYARASKKKDVIEDMLMKKAAFARTTGNAPLATVCYKEIFTMNAKGKDDNGKEKCFKDLIAKAKQDNNDLMAGIINKMYDEWTDSIAGIRAVNELKTVKAQYAEAQDEISTKATTITAQWAFIVILIVIGVGLAAGLIFFLFVMFKNVREIKRLKTSLDLANSNNEQKNKFLNNISAQIRPSLDAMEQGDTKRQVKALQNYIAHIENYMMLEQTREEHYELTSHNMGQFCEKVTQEVKAMVKSTTEVTCTAQPISFATNEDALRTILLNIVEEVVKADGVERINLEFKKRNPHTGNFLVTAVGMTLPEEKRETLFQAFSEIADLTEDDGLTFPTCSLMAYKLNGHLRLDDEFRHGIRFVVELKDK